MHLQQVRLAVGFTVQILAVGHKVEQITTVGVLKHKMRHVPNPELPQELDDVYVVAQHCRNVAYKSNNNQPKTVCNQKIGHVATSVDTEPLFFTVICTTAHVLSTLQQCTHRRHWHAGMKTHIVPIYPHHEMGGTAPPGDHRVPSWDTSLLCCCLSTLMATGVPETRSNASNTSAKLPVPSSREMS